MSWIARPLAEERLKAAVAPPGPGVVALTGAPGVGVSGLLRRLLRRLTARKIAFTATVGPPPSRLARAAEAWQRGGVESADPVPSWPGLVEALLDRLQTERQPVVVVVDDAPELLDADAEAAGALAALWTGARRHALPLHLVLAGHDEPVLERWIDEALAGARPARVHLPPVRVDELRVHLADWPPEERYLIRACLGSRVETLGRVDPGLRAATNVFRLVIDPEGPLHDLPPRRLREQFQKPERYAGIVGALAEGAREWARIRSRNPAFRSGNQLAPYLSALQDRGWVDAALSLDAPPGSRGRRYHVADSFVAFWYAVAEPARDRLLAGESPGRVARELPLGPHLERVLPHLVRAALLEGVHDPRLRPPLPLHAREMGGVWGPEVDLPISGTLRNGAILHGVGVWGRPADEADAEAALRARRATRYGYGRESRFVLLATTRGVSPALARRAARDDRLLILPLQFIF